MFSCDDRYCASVVLPGRCTLGLQRSMTESDPYRTKQESNSSEFSIFMLGLNLTPVC